MKLIMTVAALALLAPLAARSATERGWAPFDAPRGAISARPQAMLALRCDGVTHVRNLQRVGDYWEGSADADGMHKEVYLFDNGTLWIGHRPAPPKKLTSLPAACEKGSHEFG